MHALYRDHMGSDLSVVQDARISFAADTEAKSWSEIVIPDEMRCPSARNKSFERPMLSLRDRNLINFLARGCRSGKWEATALDISDGDLKWGEVQELMHWLKHLPTHWTPFAQQEIKLRMKAPVPIRTQSFKHKQGFVENEESRRYIKSTPELFIPEYRLAPEGDIKQGSGGPHPDNKYWQGIYKAKCHEMLELYEAQISAGIAPEQARFSLPQGVYVNWVWKGSLYSYANFFNQRSDPHAQQEIRDLAKPVGAICELLFPYSWAALTQPM